MKKPQLIKLIRESIKEQLGAGDQEADDFIQIDTSTFPTTGTAVIAARCEDTPYVPGTYNSIMHLHTGPTCLLGVSSIQVGDVVNIESFAPYPASMNPNNIPHGQTGYINTTIFTPVNQTAFVMEVLGTCSFHSNTVAYTGGGRRVIASGPIQSNCTKCCSTIDSNGHWLNGQGNGYFAPCYGCPIPASGACFNGCPTEPIGTIQLKKAPDDEFGTLEPHAKNVEFGTLEPEIEPQAKMTEPDDEISRLQKLAGIPVSPEKELGGGNNMRCCENGSCDTDCPGPPCDTNTDGSGDWHCFDCDWNDDNDCPD